MVTLRAFCSGGFLKLADPFKIVFQRLIRFHFMLSQIRIMRNHFGNDIGYQYSKHALKRMQQRGISRETVEQIVRYGKRKRTHEAWAYSLTRKQKERLLLERKVSAQQTDRLEGIEVIAVDWFVITVQHITRRRRSIS